MRFRLRSVVILAALALSGLALLPSWNFRKLTPAQQASSSPEVEKLRKHSLHLGLDLQGGIHLVLGIDGEAFRNSLLTSLKTGITQRMKEESLSVLGSEITSDGLVILLPAAAAGRPWAEYSAYFPELTSPTETPDPASSDRIRVSFRLEPARLQEEVHSATSRAIEIIRNRIDYYGVKEPIIQAQGSDRIVVELAGATDPAAAKELVGRTAQLEFHRVRTENELVTALTAADSASGGRLQNLWHAERDRAGTVYGVWIPFEARAEAEAILSSGAVLAATPVGSRIALGYENVNRRDGTKNFPLYLIEREPAMNGSDLVNARPQPDPTTGKWLVSFQFGPEGAEAMGRLTGELLPGNKPLGIVVDGRVVSAPSVKGQIRDQGQISGTFDLEGAKRLAVMLKAGNLPAPVRVLTERIVGPSLGRDSIEKGLHAAVVSFVLVLLFMLLYYRAGGVVASVALCVNLFLLVGILAGFGATLTLPGIAGIVLTLGMAVDANVLIYERIKEELRAGRPFRNALEAGFNRAITTILDSNVTTAIPGFFLYQFGTGPVKGFALTLLIGICTSLFTGVYVSRYILDFLVWKGVKRIPLGGGA